MKIVNTNAFDKAYINCNYTLLQKLGSNVDKFLVRHDIFRAIITSVIVFSGLVAFVVILSIGDDTKNEWTYGITAMATIFACLAVGAAMITDRFFVKLSNWISSWISPLRRKRILKKNTHVKLTGTKHHNFSFFDIEYCEPVIISKGNEIKATFNVNFFYHCFREGWKPLSGEKDFRQTVTVDTDHVNWREQLQDYKSVFRQEVEGYLNERNNGVFGMDTPFRENNQMLEDEAKYVLSKA